MSYTPRRTGLRAALVAALFAGLSLAPVATAHGTSAASFVGQFGFVSGNNVSYFWRAEIASSDGLSTGALVSRHSVHGPSGSFEFEAPLTSVVYSPLTDTYSIAAQTDGCSIDLTIGPRVSGATLVGVHPGPAAWIVGTSVEPFFGDDGGYVGAVVDDEDTRGYTGQVCGTSLSGAHGMTFRMAVVSAPR